GGGVIDERGALRGRGLVLLRLAELPARRVKLALKKGDSCFLHAARRARPLRWRRRCGGAPFSAFAWERSFHDGAVSRFKACAQLLQAKIRGGGGATNSTAPHPALAALGPPSPRFATLRGARVHSPI